MNFTQEMNVFSNRLPAGIFLTSGTDKPNTMVIGWGFSGIVWGKPVIIVPVRPIRYTHKLITAAKSFSLSVPLDNSLNKLIGYFGSVSGIKTDKYREQGIIPQKCKGINTFIMPGNCLQIECKVIYKNDILKENLDLPTKTKWYEDESFHTLFYGEIAGAYYTK